MAAVEAIPSLDEMKRMQERLLKHKGHLYSSIWTFGINTAMRIGDQLKLRWDDVLPCLEDGSNLLQLTEQKTGKKRHVKLNASAVSVLLERRALCPNDVWVWQGKSNRAKANAGPISRKAVYRAFKDIGGSMGYNNIGTHTLRKSRATYMRSQGESIEQICKTLNQSSPAVTMAYLNLTEQSTLDTYDKYSLL